MQHRDQRLDQQRDEHLDEGTIHAWLDGALPPDESRRAEAHVAACESCAAAVAEARGLIAASSRILSSLDDVPGGVIPGRAGDADTLRAIRARRGAERGQRRRRWWADPRFAAAAGITFIAATATLVVRQSGEPLPDAARAAAERAPVPTPSPAPAPLARDVEADARRAPPASSRASGSAGIAPAPTVARSQVTPSGGATASAEAKALDQATASKREQPTEQAAQMQKAQPEQRAGQTGQAGQVGQAPQERRDVASEPASPAPRLSAAPPPPAAALGMEPAGRSTAGLALAQRTEDSAAVATRATLQLRAFAAEQGPAPSVMPPPAAALADRARTAAPSAPPATLDFVPMCYELRTMSQDSNRPAGIPERVLLDSSVVRTEGGMIWFRARALAEAQGAPALEWRPVATAGPLVAELQVAPRPEAANVAGARDAASRVVLLLRAGSTRVPLRVPPAPRFSGVPVSCPR